MVWHIQVEKLRTFLQKVEGQVQLLNINSLRASLDQ